MATECEREFLHTPLLTVTIAGGGNSAHVAAAFLSRPGKRVNVNVLTRQHYRWSSQITIFTDKCSWDFMGVMKGTPKRVTADPSIVIPQSDLVLICAPASAHPEILRKIQPYLSAKTIVGTLYAQGGFDWAANIILNNKSNKNFSRPLCIFGLQNLPWLCRILKYGEEVRLIGPKKRLYLASSPIAYASPICHIISYLFEIPTYPLPNFLCLTLSPSNQIIHPARYWGIFKNYDGESPIPNGEMQLELYAQMDEDSARMLQCLDDELQSIKRGLEDYSHRQIDLSPVLPLKQRIIKHYGDDIGNLSTLRSVFATNRGYAGCETPAIEKDGGYIPDISSRFFHEDIPYGLCVLKDIAQMMNINTPHIDFLILWHQKLINKEYIKDGKLNKLMLNEMGTPSSYGITSIDSLVSLYLPSPSPKSKL